MPLPSAPTDGRRNRTVQVHLLIGGYSDDESSFVQKQAQLLQTIPRHRRLVSRDRVIAVVTMAARRAIYAISQVNKLVSNRDFN